MKRIINGIDLVNIIKGGAKYLSLDCDRINSLNVFPVPDGDTGTNMKMTIVGGINAISNNNIESISEASKIMARGMLLNARGNSGVILSQFFKGISIGFEGINEASVLDFSKAMVSGRKKAYEVVSNPVEGTILTVVRESVENVLGMVNENTSFEEYFEALISQAKISLKNTPNLLPILKKAGVIDSGGAGYLAILEGMYKALLGEEIEAVIEDSKTSNNSLGSFDRNSELTYGYCTEFILQLQTSKVDIDSFNPNIIVDYLKSIGGNSIVSLKDDDIVKIHVHLFDPGLVLSYARKFGEFLSIKIENMNVQHSENEAFYDNMNLEEEKDFAVLCVASGDGIKNTLTELGADLVISGGQTMNTSTKDFIDAFEKINAKNIIVFPNNSNIIMAANQAKDEYTKANVYVIPTKSVSECVSSLSMIDMEMTNIDDIVETLNSVINNVKTLEITYSIRDTIIDNIEIKKDDYISLYNGNIILKNKNRLALLKESIDKIKDEFSMITLIYGIDVNEDEILEIKEYINSYNIETYIINGGQSIYSYILGLE